MAITKSGLKVGVRLLVLAVTVVTIAPHIVSAQGVIPGSGVKISDVGDNFDDPKWTFIQQGPKSSENIDLQMRMPRAQSSNGIWIESNKRGHPDVVVRIDTPDGGLPESKGALFMQTLQSGIPGSPTGSQHQDDLIMHFSSSLGGAIPVSWSPSMVVRVYIPPFEKWEQRTGASFGWRVSVTGYGQLEEEDTPVPRRRGFFSHRPLGMGVDSFYPGMFIQFNSKKTTRKEKDSAVIVVRGNESNRDFHAREITEPGWWTLGMSFTGDGRAHYYASPGVDNLTAADHISSNFPQGVNCHRVNTMFFNIVNLDDGKSWSTPWVIDDPSFYTMYSPPNYAIQPNTPVRR